MLQSLAGIYEQLHLVKRASASTRMKPDAKPMFRVEQKVKLLLNRNINKTIDEFLVFAILVPVEANGVIMLPYLEVENHR